MVANAHHYSEWYELSMKFISLATLCSKYPDLVFDISLGENHNGQMGIENLLVIFA